MLQALVGFCVGLAIGAVTVEFISMRRRLKRVRGFERMMDAMAAMGMAARQAEEKLDAQRQNADLN